MMSSSDNFQDDFVPSDIGAFKRFDEEIAQNQSGEGVDSDEFKALFSPLDGENKNDEAFAFLHGSGEKKESTEPFSLLFHKGGKKEEQPELQDQYQEEFLPKSLEENSDQDDEAFLEKQAIEKAYQSGFDQGHTEGFAQGHKEGLEKGEQEGLVNGEEKGFQQGYEKGEQEGIVSGEQQGLEVAKAAAREEVKDILDTLKDAFDEVNSLTDHIVDRYEQQFLRLVFKIAEKVVGVTLDADDSVVKRTILDALKNLVNPEEIVLSVSPDDYSYIEMVKDEFFENISSLQSISVQSDSLINPGGCKIETRTGTVSADPEEKMKAIKDALMSFHNP